MSDPSTPRAALPLLAAAQAQKHVTHNEALLQLDALLFARFVDRDLTAPPSSPADGDTYLVKATASGAWTGQSGKIAYASSGAWRFAAPFAGFAAYVVDESKLIVFNGTAWVDYASILALQNVPLLGVNTTADATNKLAVKSAALLLDNIGNGVQAKLNKNAAGDTASLLYQTAYSGRAEIGLAGDDDFHFKVSPDGATWYDALKLARAGGAASFVGPAAAASFVPSGSAVPANGLFLPAANTLGWAVNAAEKARLTASGHLLVGTATDSAMLTVNGTGQFNDALRTTGLGINQAPGSAGTLAVTSASNAGGTVIAQFQAANATQAIAIGYNFVGENSANPWNLTYNGTSVVTIGNGLVGINMAPSNVLDIAQTQNGGAVIGLANASAGTAAYAGLQLVNANGAGTGSSLYQLGSGFTTGGINRQDGTKLQGGGAGGLTLNTGAAQPIYFGINSSEVARLDTNGYLLAGFTSSNGAYRIQCNSQMFATNATIATSDLTRKNVRAATHAYRFGGGAVETPFSPDLLAAVRDIPALMYDRKDEAASKTQFGYGAQHWQAALDRVAPLAPHGWRAVQAFADDSLGLTDSDAHTLKIAALEHFKADRSELEALRARLARLEAAMPPGQGQERVS
ncbi:MAG: DUF2793 domain-containing protein [Rhizomicrobium sp.]